MSMSTRLPPLTTPKVAHVNDVIVDSFIAVIVCYSVTLSLEKVFAKKHGYTIHPNQVCVRVCICMYVSYVVYVCLCSVSCVCSVYRMCV